MIKIKLGFLADDIFLRHIMHKLTQLRMCLVEIYLHLFNLGKNSIDLLV